MNESTRRDSKTAYEEMNRAVKEYYDSPLAPRHHDDIGRLPPVWSVKLAACAFIAGIGVGAAIVGALCLL